VPNIDYVDTGIYRLKQNFYFGCTSIDTFNLNVFPSVTVSTQTLYSICEGKSMQLSASGTGTFKWTPSTGLSNDAISNPIASPRDSTIYKVLLTNTFGCKDSAEVKMDIFRNPIASAGPDRTIVVGDTVLLNGSVTGTGIRTSWSPAIFINNPQFVTPKVFPPQNTQYTLTAISTVGCGTATSSTLVKVFKGLFIPSAFTPNGDGINDRFRIIAADGYKLNSFLIYNRLGQLVYSAKEASDGWDGNLNTSQQSADTYVYYLEIETSDRKKITRKGTITLVR
jgi:gliding motility-associated-like protein